jgi:hypothetical protein
MGCNNDIVRWLPVSASQFRAWCVFAPHHGIGFGPQRHLPTQEAGQTRRIKMLNIEHNGQA